MNQERLDRDCSVRPVRPRDRDQGYHHEDAESEVLDADEHVLQPVGDLDAAVGDPGHDRDEHDPQRRHPKRAVRE